MANATLNRKVKKISCGMEHGDNIVRRVLVLVVVEHRENDAAELVLGVGNAELATWPQNIWTQRLCPNIKMP